MNCRANNRNNNKFESYTQRGYSRRSSETMLVDLYVLKKTLNYPKLNFQPGESKLRVVEKYIPKVKGW